MQLLNRMPVGLIFVTIFSLLGGFTFAQTKKNPFTTPNNQADEKENPQKKNPFTDGKSNTDEKKPRIQTGRRQFGNIVFEIPAGFKKGNVHEGTINPKQKSKSKSKTDKKDLQIDQPYLTIYADGKGVPFGTIQIYSSYVKSEKDKWSLKEFAEAQMASDLINDELDLVKNSATSEINGGVKISVFTRLVRKRGQKMQMYMAVELKDRYELFRMQTPVDDKEEIEFAKKMNKDFVSLVSNAKFVSQGAKAVLADPTPGKLHGVWWGGGLQTGLGIDGMIRLDFVTSTYTFFPDGRFFEGIPDVLPTDKTVGMEKKDYERYALYQTHLVGNYRIEGKKLFLDFADGEVEDHDYNIDTISIGVKSLSQCKVPPDGFTFDGVRDTVFYSGFAPGLGSGGVSAWSSTTFKKDGTFKFNRGSGASATFNTGGGYAMHSSDDNEGKYAVKGGYIELLDKNNKSFKRWTILLSEGEEDKKKKTYILVDGDFIKGKDK